MPPLTNTFVTQYNPTTQALVDNLVNNNPITSATTNVLPSNMYQQQADFLSANLASQLLISHEGAASSANTEGAESLQNTVQTGKKIT